MPRDSRLQDLSPTPKLPGNEYLRLASTFHSLHAISKQVSRRCAPTAVCTRRRVGVRDQRPHRLHL